MALQSLETAQGLLELKSQDNAAYRRLFQNSADDDPQRFLCSHLPWPNSFLQLMRPVNLHSVWSSQSLSSNSARHSTMTLTPTSPARRMTPQALTMALGLTALMGSVVIQPSGAHAAVSGTASIAPGSNYTAPVGTAFDLDFSGVFTDALMNVGNYWQFNIGQIVGNSQFSNLGWEIQTNNSGIWQPVDWSTLDPMGVTTATTAPPLSVVPPVNEFPVNTNTIGLGLAGFGTTLDSAYLAKANYPTVTDVRIVGTVDPGTTATYRTKISISDLSWNGVSAPIYNNAYQASLENTVPGPLPVLGALGALGLARRLRRKVQRVSIG